MIQRDEWERTLANVGKLALVLGLIALIALVVECAYTF